MENYNFMLNYHYERFRTVLIKLPPAGTIIKQNRYIMYYYTSLLGKRKSFTNGKMPLLKLERNHLFSIYIVPTTATYIVPTMATYSNNQVVLCGYVYYCSPSKDSYQSILCDWTSVCIKNDIKYKRLKEGSFEFGNESINWKELPEMKG